MKEKKPALVCMVLVLLAAVSAVVPALSGQKGEPYDSLLDCLVRAVVLAVLFGLFGADLLAFAKEKGTVGPLWVLPCAAVAAANFPLTALLSGAAAVTSPQGIPLLALRCLLIGCTEEVAFRGVIHRAAVRIFCGIPHGYLRALLCSSALFGAFHLLNLFDAPPAAVLLQAGYTFLLGGMFAVCYDRTRRLSVCCLLHAVFDFGGHLLSSLGEGEPHDTGFAVVTAVCAVLCGLHILASLRSAGAFGDKNAHGREEIPPAPQDRQDHKEETV